MRPGFWFRREIINYYKKKSTTLNVEQHVIIALIFYSNRDQLQVAENTQCYDIDGGFVGLL